MGFCVSSLLAISAAAATASGAINFESHKIQDSWPYTQASYLVTSTRPASSLMDLVDLAHTRYEDLVFFEGPLAVYDPKEFRADQFLLQNGGPIWVSTSGHWNSVTIDAPAEMPIGINFGTQTIYDPTPHTPNLYQFTEINWSQFPFKITVTHRAWILIDPYSFRLNQYAHGWESSTIPEPGAMALMAAAGLLGTYRPRRNQ